MKQLLFSLAILISFNTKAQQVKLNKGQKIIITSTVSQDIDMGVGQMKNSTSSTSSLEVKNTDAANFDVVYKLEKIKLSVDGMGQQQSYDSEKPEDKDSELGKSIADKLGQEVKLKLNKSTGKAVAEKNNAADEQKEDADNPLGGLAEMFGASETESAVAESAVFVIPAGKKVGDSWSDSVNVKESMKGIKNYTIKSINGDEATVSLFSKLEGTNKVELQGMELDINLSAKTEGELLVNTKTSLLKKSSRVADITGTMDVMGQSMPLTSKMTEITEYK